MTAAMISSAGLSAITSYAVQYVKEEMRRPTSGQRTAMFCVIRKLNTNYCVNYKQYEHD